MINKKLPIFKLVLPEDTDDSSLGIHSISIVKKPAIEQTFVTFSESPVKRKALELAIMDEEDQVCVGPILIPDQLIYRKDDIDGEHYITIDKETIQAAAIRFAEQNNGNKVDIEHNGELVSGVVLFNTIISCKKYGIAAPANFSNLPEGSWFGVYKITNPDIWASIKAKTFEGFSITGLFEEELTRLAKQLEQALKEIEDEETN